MSRIDFAQIDEHKMLSAANWGQVMAVSTVASGLLTIALGIAGGDTGPFEVIGGLAESALAAILFAACHSFRQVAMSDEDDPGHLLVGFRRLRTYFAVLGGLIILGIFGVLGLAFVLHY